MVKIGDSIPKFELKDSSGNIVDEKSLKGKKSIIYFYSEDFSPGCTTEADEFTKYYKKFQDLEINIIGISKNSSESHKKFCREMNIPYTLLSDPDSSVAKKFGAWGLKGFSFSVLRNTFLISAEGTIVKIFPEINPRGHAEEVLKSFLKSF